MSDMLGGIRVNSMIWMSTALTLGSLYICVSFLIYIVDQLRKIRSNNHGYGNVISIHDHFQSRNALFAFHIFYAILVYQMVAR